MTADFLLGYHAEEIGCIKDPELFHPDNNKSLATLEQIRAAKAICRVCPKIIECLEYALDNPKELGIWAGTTKEDRSRLSRMQRYLARATLSKEIGLDLSA